MGHSARDAYLETQILTATPQKLRLMLVEGALRFAHQAIECWGHEDHRAARCNALGRCHEILTELYGSIRADALPVAKQVKSIYAFLFRQLADAATSDDCQKVRDVARVLEAERETWRLLCEKMPERPDIEQGALPGRPEITARDCRPLAPPTSTPFSVEV